MDGKIIKNVNREQPNIQYKVGYVPNSGHTSQHTYSAINFKTTQSYKLMKAACNVFDNYIVPLRMRNTKQQQKTLCLLPKRKKLHKY